MEPTEAAGDGPLPLRRRRRRSWGGGFARAEGGDGASVEARIISSDPQPQVSSNSVGISQANGRSLEDGMDEGSAKASAAASSVSVANNNKDGVSSIEDSPMLEIPSSSSHHRHYEPLGPLVTTRRAFSDELPPPDFDETLSYPKGWLAGKKRKRVNVDVVESMRRIAVQEMRRQDREIKELNEQLEEDARCMEMLQEQLQEERKRRLDAERSNATLESQLLILADMLNEVEDGRGEEGPNDQEH